MGYIHIFETPYPFYSCISDRWGWRVEFDGDCPPAHIQMGRHLIVYAGVNRADGFWQPGGGGNLTITALRTTGENDAVFRLTVPPQSNNPGANKSWFVPGMITYPVFTDEAGGAERWISGMSTQMDIPRMQVNWDVQWTGTGEKPLVHFFDGGQKFVAASGISVGGKSATGFSPGTLIMQPKNISWNPLSITIKEDWQTRGVLSCNETDRVGWLNPEGQFVPYETEIPGGICVS